MLAHVLGAVALTAGLACLGVSVYLARRWYPPRRGTHRA